MNLFRSNVRLDLDDIGITRIGDGEHTDAEVFTTGSSQINVVAVEQVETRLGQQGVVLELGLLQWRSVVGDDHQLSLAVAHDFDRLIVTEFVLAGLHHEGQQRVQILGDRLGLSLDNGGLLGCAITLRFLFALGCDWGRTRMEEGTRKSRLN
jgi:hypothetical protein